MKSLARVTNSAGAAEDGAAVSAASAGELAGPATGAWLVASGLPLVADCVAVTIWDFFRFY